MRRLARSRLAALLGSEKPLEFSEVDGLALSQNLVVIECISCGTIAVYGAIHDEIDAWDGAEYTLILEGEEFDDGDVCSESLIAPLYFEGDNSANPRLIHVDGCFGRGWNCWRIYSNMPHSKFIKREREKTICEGLVIDLTEIRSIRDCQY